MKEEKEVVRSKNCYGKKGISLISLIITIIVIIILAAIVIFSGLNTPDRANFAKFAQNFSDYSTAIMGDFTKKKTQYAVGGQSRTDAQIYYIIATGNENIVDVNDAPTPVATIEKLGLNLHPEQLTGTEYYEITADSNIEGVNKQMQFYEASEKHYVTDKGEAFVLPGYLVPGTNRWYINEKKYYESDEPIKGPFSFEVSEWKLLSEDDDNSEEVQGTLGKGVDTAYIYFTAFANGEPATISYTPSNGVEATSGTGKIRLPISDNGEYNFTITATVEGMQKTTTKKITIADRFIQMTEASAFKYTTSSGTITITGLQNNAQNLEVINIPRRIGKDVVTSIGDCAFQYNTNITSVTISSSVTSIGKNAFGACSNLVEIAIPDSVTNIGKQAFSNCSSLASVSLPSYLTNIDSQVFNECISLNNITIPEGVTSIDSAFRKCTSLSNITIPNTVISMTGTFEECTNLSSVTLPSELTSIGKRLFYGCSSLNSITIPNDVASIGADAFRGCSSLNEISIPNNVTTIGEYAFYGCSALSSIAIPDGITSLDSSVFKNCRNLRSITIPNSVTILKGYVFEGCNQLESVTISQNVTSIWAYSFNGCIKLKDVYYSGTEAQWNSITKASKNEPLTKAIIHCSDGDIND